MALPTPCRVANTTRMFHGISFDLDPSHQLEAGAPKTLQLPVKSNNRAQKCHLGSTSRNDIAIVICGYLPYATTVVTGAGVERYSSVDSELLNGQHTKPAGQ